MGRPRCSAKLEGPRGRLRAGSSHSRSARDRRTYFPTTVLQDQRWVRLSQNPTRRAAAPGSPPPSSRPSGTPPRPHWHRPRGPSAAAPETLSNRRAGGSCSRRLRPWRRRRRRAWPSAAPAPLRHPVFRCGRRGGCPSIYGAWRSHRAALWPPFGRPGGPVVAKVADRQFSHLVHHNQDPGPAGRGSCAAASIQRRTRASRRLGSSPTAVSASSTVSGMRVRGGLPPRPGNSGTPPALCAYRPWSDYLRDLTRRVDRFLLPAAPCRQPLEVPFCRREDAAARRPKASRTPGRRGGGPSRRS